MAGAFSEKYMEGPVFIETDATNIADGDALEATLYRSGTRSIIIPEGAVLTVKRSKALDELRAAAERR